jgi:hypothetical protein
MDVGVGLDVQTAMDFSHIGSSLFCRGFIVQIEDTARLHGQASSRDWQGHQSSEILG